MQQMKSAGDWARNGTSVPELGGGIRSRRRGEALCSYSSYMAGQAVHIRGRIVARSRHFLAMLYNCVTSIRLSRRQSEVEPV